MVYIYIYTGMELPAAENAFTQKNCFSPNQCVFKLPSSDVEHIEVYRQCPPLLVEAHSQLIARLFQDELVEANKPNRFIFEDGDPNVRDGCRYAMRFVDSTGFQSKYSNFVAWLGQSIP